MRLFHSNYLTKWEKILTLATIRDLEANDIHFVQPEAPLAKIIRLSINPCADSFISSFSGVHHAGGGFVGQNNPGARTHIDFAAVEQATQLYYRQRKVGEVLKFAVKMCVGLSDAK